MTKKLRLCPFCGGHAVIYKEKGGYLVACNVCGNRTIRYKYMKSAVNAWNCRCNYD